MAKGIEIAMFLTAYDKATRVINEFATKNQARLSAWSKKASEMGDKAFDVGKKAGAFGLAVLAPIGLAIHSFEEAEVATKRLNNVFKQMGDRTGEAARQSAEYASKLQMQIGQEDEEIMAVQAKLATFRQASNETARMAGIFDRATEAAFDLAAAGFGEASGNAVALGKALENPTKGIKALAKSGVTFTAEEQKKIAALQKSGKILEAQKIVMSAIETQVKGTARATATQGAITKISMGEVMESIGKIFLPMLNQVLKRIADVMGRVNAWIDRNPKLAKNIAFVAATVGGLSLAVSGLSFVFGGLAKAWSFATMVGSGFMKLLRVTTYEMMLSTIKTKANAIATWWSTAATNAARVGMALFRGVMIGVNLVLSMNPFVLIAVAAVAVAALIYKNWDKIKNFFIKLWEKIKEVFIKTWHFIKDLFLKYHPVGMIISHWDKIKEFFANLWINVTSKFTAFVNFVLKLPLKLFDAGKNIVKSVWEGMKSFITKPVELVKNMVKKIRDFLPFSPAKEGALRDIHRIRLVETISENIKPAPMVNAMRRTTAAAMMASQVAMANPAMKAPPSSFTGGSISTGSSITLHYAPVITIQGGAADTETVDSFDRLLQKHKSEIIKILADYNKKNDRLKY